MDVRIPNLVADGKFHHYCLSHDGRTLRLYVDGTHLVGSKNVTLDTQTDGEEGIFKIGSWGGWWFNGRLAQVAVYDRALEAPEIEAVARYALSRIIMVPGAASSPKVLYQQCIYRNGRLLPSNVFANELTNADTTSSYCNYDVTSRTTKCEFHDAQGIQPTNNRKRYYCLRQYFCDPSKLDASGRCSKGDTDKQLTTFSCTTGLAYDGKPSDFIPTYEGFSGIKFQFLDTALIERGFQVFRTTPDAGPDERGQLIADIPVGSRKCGQQFAPVQYADRETGSVPQSRVTYIVAVKLDDDRRRLEEEDDGDDLVEEMRVDYISPWAGQIKVNIQGEDTPDPVSGVTIVVQHLIDVGGEVREDENWQLILQTGTLGDAEHAITVTDPSRWSSQTQYFTARPYKCDGPDGTFHGDFTECDGGVLHEFEPEVLSISIDHEMSGEITGTDVSTRSVTIYAMYAERADTAGDFLDIFGTDANYRNYVPGDDDDEVSPTKDCVATLFGRCYCPVAGLDVTFEIDGDDSGKEEKALDDVGQLVQAMSMSQGFTLSFTGPNGHRFDVWDVTGTNPRKLTEASTEPSYHFEKLNASVVLAFVDVEVGTMAASILGGTTSRSTFISGQRIFVERESCQFHARPSSTAAPRRQFYRRRTSSSASPWKTTSLLRIAGTLRSGPPERRAECRRRNSGRQGQTTAPAPRTLTSL